MKALLCLLFISIKIHSQPIIQHLATLQNPFSITSQAVHIFTNLDSLSVLIDPSTPPMASPPIASCAQTSNALLKLVLSSDASSIIQCSDNDLRFIGNCDLEDLNLFISSFLQLKSLVYYPSVTIHVIGTRVSRKLQVCSPGVNGCALCSSATLCKTPQVGFYLNSTFAAQRCMIGCQNCTNSTNCFSCFNGYVFSGKSCVPCPGNCLFCNVTGICINCEIGFYLDLGGCKPCMPGCLICANYTSCGSTSQGYSLINQDEVLVCPTGCSSCSPTGCQSCLSAYFLSNSVCLPCSNQCTHCSSTSSCSSCGTGFYLKSSSVCMPCPSNCLVCSATGCSQCATFYFITPDGLCENCLANCDECENNLSCDQCSGGYFFNKNTGICVYCGTGCATCSVDGCAGCATVGYTNITNTCQACSAGCGYCVGSSCYSCFQGYYLNGVSCSKCAQTCLTCVNSVNCTGCQAGYFLNSTTCSKCPYGCQQCYDADCYSCQEGFFLQDFNCISCPIGCFSCSSEQTCENCTYGYYLMNDGCQVCSHGASYCISYSNALACQNGYFFNSAQCQACGTGCLSCSSSSCYYCSNGFVLTSGACQPCTNNCVNCQPGYFLANSSCYSCNTSCLQCTSSTTCTNCQAGYWVKAGGCVSCPQSCSVCLNSTVCLECLAGYTLSTKQICIPCNTPDCLCLPTYYSPSNFQCLSCPFSCQSCSNSLVCESCVSGYYLNSSLQCSNCPQYCSVCVSGLCTQCLNRFYLDKNVCKPCNMYCLSCESLTICNSCEKNFYLDTYGVCQPCQSQCEQCNIGGCTSCYPGFNLTSSGNCTQYIEYCLIYENGECIYCINGFTPKFGYCLICEDIQVVSAQFTSDFTSIQVAFSLNINITITNKNNCTHCNEIARTDGFFGSSCSCSTSANVLTIKFGTDYSLTSSSSILVITGQLFKYVCHNDQKSFQIQATYSTIPLKPIPFIRYHPIQSLNCTETEISFEVNTVYNSYGFSLIYTWLLSTSPTNQIVEGQALLVNTRKMTISLDLFNGVETEFNVTVNVQNMVQLQGTQTVTAQVVTQKFLVIEIDALSPFPIIYNQDYVIAARIFDTCDTLHQQIKLVTNENLVASNFTSRLQNLFYIPVFSIPPRPTPYQFQAVAFSLGGPSGYLNFSLFSQYAPLVIMLNIQYSDISAADNFTLNASQSYNPNINDPVKKYTNLYFDWYYCFYFNQTDCEYIYPDQYNSFYIFDSSELSNYIDGFLEVIVFLSSPGYETVNKTAIFTIKESLPAKIYMFADKPKYEMYNFGINFNATVSLNPSAVSITTLLWNITGLVSSTQVIYGKTTPQLYIDRKSLAATGVYYTLTLSALQGNEVVSSAYMIVSKSLVPTCGSNLSVTPLIPGKEKIYEDTFVMLMSDCTDPDNDYPLTYRFSIRTCQSNCSAPVAYQTPTAYYELCVKRSFLEMYIKIFFPVFDASVQICDSMKTCLTNALLTLQADNNTVPLDLLDRYLNDTSNRDFVPYYGIMYMKVFRNELATDEFNYIYNDFALYMSKQKIVNFDVVHIFLSFINELFKESTSSLNLRFVRQYLNQAWTVIRSDTDPITSQNRDVTCSIIDNLSNIFQDNIASASVITQVIQFAEKIFFGYSYNRVVGDIIINTINPSSQVLKYRDTAYSLQSQVPAFLIPNVSAIYNVSANNLTIISVSMYKMHLQTFELYMVSLTSSGLYSYLTLNYTTRPEDYTTVYPNAMDIVTDNNVTGRLCFSFDGNSWEKETLCKASLNHSVITISSNELTRVEDPTFGIAILASSIAPLVISLIIVLGALIGCVIVYLYDKKVERGISAGIRKRKKKTLKITTGAVMVKNMLVFSICSNDKYVNSKHKILQFALILNIQLFIEGAFYGWNVIGGKTETVIAGIGFLAPMFTIPYGVLSTYNLDKEKRWKNILFVVLWIAQLILFTVGVVLINFSKTAGKDEFWVESFGVGVCCEIVVEFWIMVWKNIKDRSQFLELDKMERD